MSESMAFISTFERQTNTCVQLKGGAAISFNDNILDQEYNSQVFGKGNEIGSNIRANLYCFNTRWRNINLNLIGYISCNQLREARIIIMGVNNQYVFRYSKIEKFYLFMIKRIQENSKSHQK